MKSALYHDCLFSQKIEVVPFLNLDLIDSIRNSFMNHEISELASKWMLAAALMLN